MRTLTLFAHPSFEKSRIHAALVGSLPDLDSVTFRDLYERYPDFDIDVKAEQELLAEHDLIILQHPLYWYSVPPLMKQWIDLVRELTGVRAESNDRYISEARRRIADLEDILRADLADEDVARDAAWDDETLREEYGPEAGFEQDSTAPGSGLS